MIILYNILVVIVIVLAVIPLYIIRLLREKGFSTRFRQSFGFIPKVTLDPIADKGCIWLHAASVGEIVAASPIVKEMRKQLPKIPILISVITVNGYAMAKQIIPEADSIIFILPDLPFQVRNLISRIKPNIILLVETELWPNFLWNAQSMGIPVLTVNGRLSEKSLSRFLFILHFFPHILTSVTRFCMQSISDAQRIIKVGADPHRVFVTGNTKFDQTYIDTIQSKKEELLLKMGLKTRWPIIIAGSTHKGEEEILFTSFKKIQEYFDRAVLIIAPREITRAEAVANLANNYNLSPILRTTVNKLECNHNVVVLNTIGELGKIYSIGDIVFVGGSLVPKGGHNILEPAVHGKAILVGPYMFNFKDIYDLFSKRGACETAFDCDDLTEKLIAILANDEKRQLIGERALLITRENRGAANKTVQHIKEILHVS
ncbi:3-deoxy-D-manno-octulosonic acid transferase [Pelosinus sp. IPA-1]|uniref:3-deoxy-D-manno-octulosonic acid transferase n=1 Tax=Pelosinus sp. IPA-1 TaxID=3029569 RepID=UPI00243626AB|nr:3-deoxy-D-manno-octulosonic acid transferase [Pelosinus sp. IPA-1]GMB00004.1 3-deoxy-D-manno-octulosonic acid transferase [Pelosinus sp. IPA-1]